MSSVRHRSRIHPEIYQHIYHRIPAFNMYYGEKPDRATMTLIIVGCRCIRCNMVKNLCARKSIRTDGYNFRSYTVWATGFIVIFVKRHRSNEDYPFAYRPSRSTFVSGSVRWISEDLYTRQNYRCSSFLFV